MIALAAVGECEDGRGKLAKPGATGSPVVSLQEVTVQMSHLFLKPVVNTHVVARNRLSHRLSVMQRFVALNGSQEKRDVLQQASDGVVVPGGDTGGGDRRVGGGGV